MSDRAYEIINGRKSCGRFAVLVLVLAAASNVSAQEHDLDLPPVYLNHVYVVLDEASYRALAGSDFIRGEFADSEVRETETAEGSAWSGLYLYGETTYIEFLQPSDAGYKPAENECGIGLGVEEVGGIEVCYLRMKEALRPVRVVKELWTLKTADKNVPWFYWIEAMYEEGATLFSTWIMEYREDFLHTASPETFPQGSGIGRRTHLKKFYTGGRYFKDVVEVVLALDSERAGRFVRELEILGYSVETDSDRVVCRGPDIDFVLLPATGSGPAIVELKTTLSRRKTGGRAFSFGSKATLEFGDGAYAVWRFK